MPRKKIEVTPINTRLEVVATCTVAQLSDGRIAILREAQKGEEWGALLSIHAEGCDSHELATAVSTGLAAALPKTRKRRKKVSDGAGPVGS